MGFGSDVIDNYSQLPILVKGMGLGYYETHDCPNPIPIPKGIGNKETGWAAKRQCPCNHLAISEAAFAIAQY